VGRKGRGKEDEVREEEVMEKSGRGKGRTVKRGGRSGKKDE
jgi:hypothetical protein